MVSLDAEGDCLPQNEGAPDGLPFFFSFLVSFLSTALSWQSHGFCECLMKSSFLILVVVFFFSVCMCMPVYTHVLHSSCLLGRAVLPETRQSPVSFKWP